MVAVHEYSRSHEVLALFVGCGDTHLEAWFLPCFCCQRITTTWCFQPRFLRKNNIKTGTCFAPS